MHKSIRLLGLWALACLIAGTAFAQSGGQYWFGSLANAGDGMPTTDGRITYIGSGYNGPYDYFVTMDQNAQVQAFTTHTVVGRPGNAAGSLLTPEGDLLRGISSMRPGTNIPEMVLCLTDADHNVLWTRTYTIPGYRGSVAAARFGWTYGDGFLIQVTFIDSNHVASARVNGLLHVDRAGEVVRVRTAADLPYHGTCDTLPNGDLLFGTGTRLTRTDRHFNPIWSKAYATGGASLHPVSKPVDVGPAGDIRLLWNMGDTTFQLPGGGAPTWPAYAGLLTIDPASGAIQASRRIDMVKPFRLHGITALATGHYMLYGSYNTLRPYLPHYMRVHGLLQRVTPAGDLLAVDTFHYSPQLRSSEILRLEESGGQLAMSINLHDGTNPGRYLVTTDAQGQLPCEWYPASAVSAGTVAATASDHPLWQLTDVQATATDLASTLSPASVNIVRLCGAIPTGIPTATTTALQAWPNPATDRITIAWPQHGPAPGAGHLADLTGAVLQVPAQHTAEGMALDLRGLPAGLYAWRSAGGHTVRFVKE